MKLNAFVTAFIILVCCSASLREEHVVNLLDPVCTRAELFLFDEYKTKGLVSLDWPDEGRLRYTQQNGDRTLTISFIYEYIDLYHANQELLYLYTPKSVEGLMNLEFGNCFYYVDYFDYDKAMNEEEAARDPIEGVRLFYIRDGHFLPLRTSNAMVTDEFYSPQLKLDLFRKMLSVVKSFYTTGNLHRNINMDSFFVKRIEDDYELVLGGFQHMQPINESDGYKPKNSIYTAPEALKDDNYSDKGDIYSLGAVLYSLFNFQDSNGEEPDTITKRNKNSSNSIYCRFVENLVLQMTSQNPQKRPNIDTVLDSLTVIRTQLDTSITHARANPIKVKSGGGMGSFFCMTSKNKAVTTKDPLSNYLTYTEFLNNNEYLDELLNNSVYQYNLAEIQENKKEYQPSALMQGLSNINMII